ncbi:MAG: hypothetical protein K8F91_11450 [Candidatus Obscuribacterales bacterium]|nr:hypothetical protein [Candidatus Obscuribacterales bacterium]
MSKFKEIINCAPPKVGIKLGRELELGGFIAHDDYLERLLDYGKFVRDEPTATEEQRSVFDRLVKELPQKERIDMLREILDVDGK